MNKKSIKTACPCRLRTMAFVLFVMFITTEINAQIMSLDSLLLMVDRQNPMLQQYDNKVIALNEYSRGARSWMAPMVGAGTFMRPYPGQNVMQENEKGSWMVSVEQDIPNPSKLKARSAYQQSRAKVESSARAVALNNLRNEIKLNYFQWLVSERKLRVLQENVEIVELMIKIARIRYPYNQASLGNVYKAEARLSELENMILMVQSDISMRRARLASIANLNFNDSLQIDTTTTVTFTGARAGVDTAQIRISRSDIRQIDDQIKLMQLNQNLQRYQSRPDFRIRFDHMQPVGDMPRQFTAMAMVSIPIAPWSSRMYKAEVKSMEFDIEALRKERDAIVTEAQGMLTGTAAQIAATQKQLINYESRILPALKKNYEATMIGYEENREPLPMVIDGWEALNMAQQEYFSKMENYYTMIVNYETILEK